MATSSCPLPSGPVPQPSLASAALPTEWKRDGRACRTAAVPWRWRHYAFMGTRTETSASQPSPGRTERPPPCICSMPCSGRLARPRPCWARSSSASASGLRESINTTPESLDIVRSLAELREIGGSQATIEASSHALALARIYGIEFHTAVFTNLSREHLDFHGDMESYAAAKRRLFEGAGARQPLNAVINSDDEAGRDLLDLGGSRLLSYGRGQAASVRASGIQSDARGVRFDVDSPAGRIRVESNLIGDFNVDNILAAVGAAQCHGLGAAEIEAGLMAAPPAPGRFETVDCGQPFLVVVDYAHTPHALYRSIEAAREIAQRKDPPGRVLTLFGCGGDRDRTKRAPMGNIAGKLSDFVMLTSDNPRSEDPQAIIQEVAAGLRQASDAWTAHLDRAEAIKGVLYEARCRDIVLIAGKGHETTQTTREGTLPFDDRKAVRAALHAKGYHRA